MVKKKVKKTKSKEVYFKNFNLNKKIISVVLIVLAIGIISNIFPGDNVTGNAPNVDSILGILSGGNKIVTEVFKAFFGAEDPQIVYARIVLISLIVAIVFLIMTSIEVGNPFIKILVGIVVAYLSTMFIPMEAILATGLLYSSLFMSIIFIIPLILFGIMAIKLKKTRGGYILKSVAAFVMLYFVGALEELISVKNEWIDLLILAVYLVVIGGLLYSIYRIFTVEEAEAGAEKAIDAAIPALQGGLYDIIGRAFKKISSKPPGKT